MRLLTSQEWKPQGIESLEANAEHVVRVVDNNILVTAGPGAGKSELLAQKASYILQTGKCERDKRILAISFKKDSAKNLKERVELRCGKELAGRFDSMTFDAFAKNILDRFKLALPDNWTIEHEYEIDFSISTYKEMEKLFDEIGLTESEKYSLNSKTFERNNLTADLLPIDGFNEVSTAEKATKRIWNLLLNSNPSRLSFTMIGRLVELIFRVNPKLLLALQSTYSYVFLDEFQDTTSIQYDLVKTCFMNTNIKVTAVGDEKQTIMSWAGALDNIFNIYKTDFTAVEYQLINNYRSSKTLVTMQNIIVDSLMKISQTDVISMKEEGSPTNTPCRVLYYKNNTQEAKDISLQIQDLIVNQSISTNEICILTKQQPDIFTEKLQYELKNFNIKSRVENELQDLLSEPFTNLILIILRLIFLKKSPDDWIKITEYHAHNYSENHDDNELCITKFINHFRDNIIDTIEYSENGVFKVISMISSFLNEDILKSVFQHYAQGNYLHEIKIKVSNYLNSYLHKNSLDWILAIEDFEGKDSIKIMTLHKSKGLEFHTIIFIGLEDNSHWNYGNNPLSDNNGFFVAFSRAKEQIIFTVSHRDHYRGNASIKNIKPIFDIFKLAGVNAEIREII
ncbi:MAG: ATP-dependent helicase [Sulfurimonas sp.]|nr:ATP-dependent helicase [Sulfurimonas sp.]